MNTPYYVIDYHTLDENFKKLTNALNKYWNNYIVGYSYKTNSLPWIINYFHKNGCYAEVTSEEEYQINHILNNNKNNVIYNGPVKSEETFLEAINNGAIVNIDSQREIEWLKKLDSKDVDYNLGIRVNLNLENICPGHTHCGSSRFGFGYENGELDKAITKIRSYGFNINCLHMHTSTTTRAVEIYRILVEKSIEISQKYNLDLKFLDVGGGFFGGLADKPQFDDYISNIGECMNKYFSPDKTVLIVEPGMALIGAPVKYVTSVIDTKDVDNERFVVTDGSRTNIDPLMHKKNYFFEVKHRTDTEKICEKQVLCGFTCLEFDRLMNLENYKELKVGDNIIYDKVGAYTMCMTPLFIKYYPDVYLEKDGKLHLLRKKWTPKEYLQNCRLDYIE